MAKKQEVVEEKILDVNASMQGTISFNDPVNLRINGSFEGKLDTKGNLTIGENAVVKASIHGDKIIVAGKVTGDIVALQSLSIISPAVIQGNITTPRLSVTDGSRIDGQVTMLSVQTSGGAPDVHLTLRDVAQYLEVEIKVVEEWAKQKKIPSNFENGDWKFTKSSIDRWIQEENVRA